MGGMSITAPYRFAGRVPRGVDPVVPKPGQESVWDYPRPPRVEAVPERVRVVVEGIAVADTERALRVLETAGAPVYYIPRRDVRLDLLTASSGSSVCEWKGRATYHAIEMPSGRRVEDAAWSYEHPNPGYAAIAGHVAFYAGRVDEAWVGQERASPQPGGFYGGWVTPRIVGPIKGEPGSSGW